MHIDEWLNGTDEWLNEHYPNAFVTTDKTGEIIVCLGVDANGKAFY